MSEKLKEAAQQLLVAVLGFAYHGKAERWEKAVNAYYAALAEPEPMQEPVAWMVYTADGKSVCVTDHPADFVQWRSLPLYTHPPQRPPLTDEEINDCLPLDAVRLPPGLKEFARRIERKVRGEKE